VSLVESKENPMATKQTAAVQTADFAEYVPAKASAKMGARICTFLAELSTLTKPAAIKSRCEQTLADLREMAQAPSTLKGWLSQYRNAAKAWAEATGNSSTLEIVLATLKESQEFYQSIQKSDEVSRDRKRAERVAIDPAKVLPAIEQGLQSSDYRELAAWVQLSIGTRLSETLVQAEVKQATNYSVKISNRSKGKGAVSESITFTLAPSGLIVDALKRLRRDPAALEMILEQWELAEVDSGKNSSVNREIGHAFKGLIDPPTGAKFLTSHHLRSAYAPLAYYLFGKQSMDYRLFIQKQLGHKSEGAGSFYSKYYCADSQGRELPHGVWVDRLDDALVLPSLEPSAITLNLDSHLLGLIESLGKGNSPEESLETIVGLAQLSQVYKAQLVAAEAEIADLRELGAAAPKRRASGEDWSQADYAILMSSKSPAAAVEKIRRCVEAIQQHNAGLAMAEQWAITPTLVMLMSGVRQGTVTEWMELHKAEIEAANEGMSYHQNRGKGREPWAEIYWEGNLHRDKCKAAAVKLQAA
jgi:integrase